MKTKLVTPRRTLQRRAERVVTAALKRIRTQRTQRTTTILAETSNEDESNNQHSRHIANLEHVESNLQIEEAENLMPTCSVIPPINNKSKLIQLGKWATEFNISHIALSKLLYLAREWLPHEGFPMDPRTLLKTKRVIEIRDIEGGKFYHFGILKHINEVIESGNLLDFTIPNLSNFLELRNLLTLKIGIDGLPISRSSNKQFWPILGKLDQDPRSRVFIISLFYGSQKPQSLETFLGPFVKEMLKLEQNGVHAKGCHYSVRIRCLVADAPARSFLKRIKAHNGYFGCERCYRRGSYKNSRILYSIKAPCEEYTDQSFRERWYECHHKDVLPSPLESLSLGMISQIPLDYMHLCLLGTMKKLLLVWTEGKRPHKLSSVQQKIISDRLINFRVQVPKEFARKCRGINDLKHWKATEFRLFLLYVGPATLRNILDAKKYEHFLLFHSAMYILVCSLLNVNG